ncbi:hypothetical protein Nepgr_013225 [Nepenthes gracilis]|uniref:Cyclin-like domain-containing protein n=1 Tax=Nepenthes gracilis TaxID=150966 RepID=A0AAD3XNX5_NEPGR|nr:hypothetical protein Nepgr_013225 [Nepenthes gracilis]
MTGLHPGESSQLGAHEGLSSRMSREKREDGGRWYFSRKEIEENSPSRKDGIDLKKETYIRKSYCTFLQDLGMRLKVPQVTIATAIIFCHRFYLHQSHAKNDRRTVATACMFLAGKVEETPHPLKDVILVSYEIIHKKDPEAVQKIKQKEVYEKQKELILLAERAVLATLGFDLNVQHPYKPLVEAIKKFKVAQNALAQVAWNFVNDGLRTSLCLQFKTHHIAAGAIFLAAKFLKVKLPSDGEKVWWQEFDVTPRQLEEVSNQMLELYEQNRVPASQGSEADGNIAGGGAANSAAPKASIEDHIANHNSSQAGVPTRPGTLKPSSAHLVPDHVDNQGGPSRGAHNQSNDYGNSVMNLSEHKEHGESRVGEVSSFLHYVGNGQNMRSSDWHGGEDKNEGVGGNSASESVELKDKYHPCNMECKEPVTAQSPPEVIKKIDEDKLKELREKRKRSRGDVIRKRDPMDEYDPIVKELEEGVELAVAESEKIKRQKKQSWPQLSTRLGNENSLHGKHLDALGNRHHFGAKGEQLRGSDLENVEEGEVSALDDPSWGGYVKKKTGSPPENTCDGKLWHDSVPGPTRHYQHDFPEDRNRLGRHAYAERDHKRHLQENHA